LLASSDDMIWCWWWCWCLCLSVVERREESEEHFLRVSTSSLSALHCFGSGGRAPSLPPGPQDHGLAYIRPHRELRSRTEGVVSCGWGAAWYVCLHRNLTGIAHKGFVEERGGGRYRLGALEEEKKRPTSARSFRFPLKRSIDWFFCLCAAFVLLAQTDKTIQEQEFLTCARLLFSPCACCRRYHAAAAAAAAVAACC
jgi:hypothetical protein